MSLCNGYMSSCEKTANKILDRLETNNPIFWNNISMDVETLQLMYIQDQARITGIKTNIEKKNHFKGSRESYKKKGFKFCYEPTAH